jgi:hypothetical protein
LCCWTRAVGQCGATGIPPSDYSGSEVVALSARDGSPVARASISTAPAGIEALHQRAGWTGLSVGEGQDGAYAWWVRLRAGQLELIDGGWTDEVLFDSDPAGTRIITTPHATGADAIKVRSFPRLEVLRAIEPPPGFWWDFYACFVGAWIVARAHNPDDNDEVLVAIDPDDRISVLARTEDPICPGLAGSWISSGSNGIARWQLTHT